MMKIQVFFAQYGVMEDNGTVWANAQMITDFVNEEGKAGCQFGKIGITTDNNNAVAKRLVGELQRVGGPVTIEITTGSKTSKGNIVTVIKDFKLADEKLAQKGTLSANG